MGVASPFWVAIIVLAVGVLTFFAFGHMMAHHIGERVLWSRWNKRAAAAEGSPEEALELV